jgi:hypothetical protein
LAYQMIAERDNERAQSRSVSLFIAAAKARVWASEGWDVVVTDDTGKKFTPAELDALCAPAPKKSRQAQPDSQSGNSGTLIRGTMLETGKGLQTPAAAVLIDTWETLESAVAQTG